MTLTIHINPKYAQEWQSTLDSYITRCSHIFIVCISGIQIKHNTKSTRPIFTWDWNLPFFFFNLNLISKTIHYTSLTRKQCAVFRTLLINALSITSVLDVTCWILYSNIILFILFLCTWVCTQGCAHGGQKRPFDSSELELHVVLNWLT